MLLFSLAVLLAGCIEQAGPSATGVPETTTTTVATTTTIGSTVAVEAFRECLAGMGIVIEEIPLDASGHPRLDLVLATVDFSDPEVAEALSVCADHLETGALATPGDDPLGQAVIDQLEAYSRCMVELGVENFPDPVPGYNGVGPPFPVAEIPYSDPNLAGATRVCREALLDALTGEDGF